MDLRRRLIQAIAGSVITPCVALLVARYLKADMLATLTGQYMAVFIGLMAALGFVFGFFFKIRLW